MDEGTRVSGIGVLDKAVRVLDAVASSATPVALADLAAATRLPRATAHRLAVALVVHGFLARDEAGAFAVGPRSAAPSITRLARPALQRLRDRTGESAQLYVRRGDERVCVLSLESPHSLRTIVAEGAALPLDRGSAGRVLSAAGDVPRWVESVEEREKGVASVSAPVRDRAGAVLAAVSVSGPVERTTRSPGRRYASAVVRAAREIERALSRRAS